MSAVHDLAIVGAGIAGASLAAECVAGRHPPGVLLLEGEDRPGYHATGRSAAFWEPTYGGPGIAPLTLASGDWLGEQGFLTKRGAIYVGRDDDRAALDAFVARFAATDIATEPVDRPALEAVIPGLLPAWTRGVRQPDCADIDVARLHAHYLAQARRGGARLETRARVAEARFEDGAWRLRTEGGSRYAARRLVNAAGAWADAIAALSGIAPLSIAPKRRTMIQLATDPAPPATMPLILAIDGRFYFKPEAGRLWLSPHDEVPSDPCDAAPEESAVAEAIDRFEHVVDWRVKRVEHRWAGLRSFAPDRLPVIGPDPGEPSFFWFAGQGGWGIQTAPAAAALAARMLGVGSADPAIAPVDPAPYLPDRLR